MKKTIIVLLIASNLMLLSCDNNSVNHIYFNRKEVGNIQDRKEVFR